jgi:signal transduction histidine kinase
MRYDAAMAREKNTSRAEARKRTREMTRAELLAAEAEEDDAELDDEPTEAAAAPRQSMFKMPNIRADIVALPSIFRSRPILVLPLALMLVGLGIYSALPGLSPDIATLAGYYLQFFFLPPALFTFFIAGFFAPRASYLVGFIYGLLAGIIWSIAVLAIGLPAIDPSSAPTTPTGDPASTLLNLLVIGVLYGTLAAALAAWYRDFLRGIQERGRAKRAGREVDERAKRREERQEARRLAKQRPTS